MTDDSLHIDMISAVKRATALGLKRSTLAFELGVSERTLYRWLRARRVTISPTQLSRLASLLKIQPSELATDRSFAAPVSPFLERDFDELIQAFRMSGRWPELRKMIEQLDLQSLSRVDRVRVKRLLGTSYLMEAKYSEASRILMLAYDEVQGLREDLLEAQVSYALGVANQQLGHYRQAIRWLRVCRRLEHGSEWLDRKALMCLGYLREDKGQRRSARMFYRAALAPTIDPIPTYDVSNFVVMKLGQALSYLESGDLEEAQKLSEETVAESRGYYFPYGEGRSWLHLALVHIKKRDIGAAVGAWKAADVIYSRIQSVDDMYYEVGSRIFFYTGDKEKAAYFLKAGRARVDGVKSRLKFFDEIEAEFALNS